MATLGIDIGGTNLSLGLVENGKIIQEIHTPSFRPEMTLDETLDYLAAQIEKVFRTGTGFLPLTWRWKPSGARHWFTRARAS